ncbi:MAG: cell division protein FtsW, partial [Chitinophagia bacterium]|nr:cell division protein FtsW [Chitinophagia bacterium]
MSQRLNSILNRTKGDRLIWAVVLILSLVSLLAVYSSTGSLAYKQQKSGNFYLIKQVMILGFGLLIIYWVHKVNYARFAKWAVFLYLVSIPLLLWTLVFGTSVHEGSRWIKIPLVNLTFQTSDLAKLALFMFLARMLSIKQSVIKSFKEGFIPVMVPVLLTCALIAPANLSTALMLGFTCTLIFFIGRVKFAHLGVLLLVGIMGLGVIYGISKLMHGRAKTWEGRASNFFNKKGDDYQVQQAKIAIALGGLTGKGPGNSVQCNFLPHSDSDFIYAIIIEEYGLLGGAFLILLYLVFLWRSIVIFRRCPYAFGAFLAVGLS